MSNRRKPRVWEQHEELIVGQNIKAILEEAGGGGISTDCKRIQLLAEELNRTPSAVMNKARIIAIKLGLLSTRSEKLARLCGVEPLESITKKKEVPEDFVRRLGLEPEVDFFEENDTVLRAIYSVVEYDHFVKILNSLKKK